jgi:long-chain acyl-CoA synthetase
MTTSHDIDVRISGQTVASRFLASLAGRPDATVLRWKDSAGEWQQQTLGELADIVARLVTSLKGLGVEPGDRVVMMMRNRPEFHALDLAILFCGATPISIYNSSAPDQIEYLVNHCGAKVAVVEDDAFLGRFRGVAERLPTVKQHVVMDPSAETVDSALRYADLLDAETTDLAEAVTIGSPDDIATVIYTSGTTGPPKGVMLTNYNVCWALASMDQAFREQAGLDTLAGLSHISYLPMAHVFERLLGHYLTVDQTLLTVCCPETSQVAAYVGEVHPNVFIGVPRVWEKLQAGVLAALSGDPERAKAFDDGVAAGAPIAEKMGAGTATDEEIATWDFLDSVAFSTVKERIGLDQAQFCVTAAAPIRAEVLSWFRTLGVPLTEGYGMSETTAIFTWAHAAKAGFVGKPMPGVELKLADDGEVLGRGGNMFGGYLNASEQTAETLDDEGWVHTGDIGVVDDDGYLKIVDRKKELIVTAGGKNISPANLEAALKGIPLVGQACALGDQRPFVAALVVLDPDAAAAWAADHGLEGEAATLPAMAENPEVIAEIEAGLKDAMSVFNNAESVKRVKVLGEEWMPDSDVMTPTAKLKRRGILTRFAAEIDALYS